MKKAGCLILLMLVLVVSIFCGTQTNATNGPNSGLNLLSIVSGSSNELKKTDWNYRAELHRPSFFASTKGILTIIVVILILLVLVSLLAKHIISLH
jgi:hypothetical protein